MRRHAEELLKHRCGGTQTKRALHDADLFVGPLFVGEQALDHVWINRHLAPDDVGVQQHALRGRLLEQYQNFRVQAHVDTALHLTVAQVMQNLGDHGFIQWVMSF